MKMINVPEGLLPKEMLKHLRKVRSLVNVYRSLTIKDLGEEMEISIGSFRTIISKDLEMPLSLFHGF